MFEWFEWLNLMQVVFSVFLFLVPVWLICTQERYYWVTTQWGEVHEQLWSATLANIFQKSIMQTTQQTVQPFMLLDSHQSTDCQSLGLAFLVFSCSKNILLLGLTLGTVISIIKGFVGCLTSQQYCSVYQGWLCWLVYVQPHWDWSRSNFLSRPVAVYWQGWPVSAVTLWR